MALIPSFFLDCVVAIGVGDTLAELTWVASGFLYGHFKEKIDEKQNWYSVYLVTNRHVFEGKRQVYLRFNPLANEKAREFPANLINEDDSPRWYSCADTEKDVAVVPINAPKLREEGIQFAYFHSDKHVADINKLKELEITEGDYSYLLGFPMGIIGGDRNFVIVRGGSIARIRDTLQESSKDFLVDAFVFPGNSGGPAVSKPEALSITGTKSQSDAYLIGIIKSYLPYKDIAISEQTKRPRVIFEENSGLAAIQPIDFIQEAIQEHQKLQGEPKETVSEDSTPVVEDK